MRPGELTAPVRFECTGNLFADAVKLHSLICSALEPVRVPDKERRCMVRLDPRPIVIVGHRPHIQEAVELALLAERTFLIRTWDEDDLVYEVHRPKVGEVRLFTTENGSSAVEITLRYEHVTTEIPPEPGLYVDGPDYDPF